MAVEDERRHAHGRQDGPQVGLLIGAIERVGEVGAEAHPHPVGEPEALLLTLCVERRTDALEHRVRELLRAPAFAQAAQLLLDAVGAFGGGGWVEERERRRPLRVRRRVQHRHRAAVTRGENDGLRRADGVEDGAHVLHPRLERGELPVAVGEARTALVEEDEPELAREALVEVPPVRRLPTVDEVRTEVGNEHEVRVRVADHLIGDRGSAALRIADVRLHRASFLDCRRSHKATETKEVLAALLTRASSDRVRLFSWFVRQTGTCRSRSPD